MADGSTKVVYAALIGNVLVAVSKFVAWILSGSSAMLTEAIHSTADTADQLVLLIGKRRGKTSPDKTHPFGYGLETYFWAFVVALIVLLVGGVASIYEGYLHIKAGLALKSPWLNLSVLGLSALFEGGSFLFGYREFRRVVHGRKIGGKRVRLWQFVQLSKDPSLFASILEDSAALIGIAVAALGVAASAFLHVLWADGAASVLIGLLLVANSAVIAEATRNLIGGEAVVLPLMCDIEALLASEPLLRPPTPVATMHLGPDAILISLTLDLPKTLTVAELEALVTTLTRRLKELDGRIAHVLVAFPTDDD